MLGIESFDINEEIEPSTSDLPNRCTKKTIDIRKSNKKDKKSSQIEINDMIDQVNTKL